MFELLDSVIAFVAILLGVSLIITVLVQAVSALLHLRGLALVKGLRELLEQAGFDNAKARQLADEILCHPMISDSILPKAWTFFARASAIRKEELARVLSNARAFKLTFTENERAHLESAKAVVQDWFDDKMDRASQVFAQSSRIVTVVMSFVVAFWLHLDSGELLSRVSSNAEIRGKLAAGVDGLQKKAEEIQKRDEEGKPPGIEQAVQEAKAIHSDLASAGIDLLPEFAATADIPNGVHTHSDYLHWSKVEGWKHFLGVLATAAFLSLGAPFWFNVLKSLTNLRSVVAKKEEQEREKAQEENTTASRDRNVAGAR
jgi:hypothetical protein